RTMSVGWLSAVLPWYCVCELVAVLLPVLSVKSIVLPLPPPAVTNQISVFTAAAKLPWKLASAADVNGASAPSAGAAPLEDASSVQLPPNDALPTGWVEAST